ncbi:amidohydrolase [Aspergillus undulatus]|uniref:amidohydrolase n=1 Tax=Aspergillus undulatus TaxID=1810928 RepID=UPI003CCE3B8D
METHPGNRNSVAYFNGRVFTVNEKQPWAAAFIVSDTGIFEAVGPDEQILGIAKQRSLVKFDLRQKFVMPGVHDAHSHMWMAGLQHLSEANVVLEDNDAKIAEKLLGAHCQCSYTGARNDWIFGNSYLSTHFPGDRPDRCHLDQLWREQPVLLRDFAAHDLLLNTAGLKALGIDESIVDPPGGAFLRRADGTLTGEVIEAATQTVWLRMPMPPLAHIKRAVAYALSTCHRYGITSAQEASANTLFLHALREMETENKLDLDVYAHILSAPGGFVVEGESSLAALLDVAEGFRSKHIHPQFVKFILDGSPVPPNLTQADLDGNGDTCTENLVVSEEKLFERLKLYDSRGMTCKLHATGEGSVRMALNVLEKVRDLNENGPRHEIAHCNAVHPGDTTRFGPLRVTAEMSPAIFHHDTSNQDPRLARWDFNAMLSAKALVTIGSDWLVTPTPDLFPSAGGIAEKIGAGCHVDDGLTDLQRGSRIVLRILTMGGAEAVGAQHRVGSIEVGKKANFIAVDRDLSEGGFRDATVLQTWFEGRVVYSARSDGLVAVS